MQNSLRENMWDCYRFVKCEKYLLKGLEDLSTLEMKLNKINISFKKWFSKFLDFNSSLVTSKTTIISSNLRKENRVSH